MAYNTGAYNTGAYNTGASGLDWIMVFNVTFNNISVISWRSVLLMEETAENR